MKRKDHDSMIYNRKTVCSPSKQQNTTLPLKIIFWAGWVEELDEGGPKIKTPSNKRNKHWSCNVQYDYS